MHAILDLEQRRKQHNDEALAFNAEIARHKQAIEAVNVVKQQYAANCADRAYRRADFTQLASDAQAAMYDGLDDIEVPYLDPPVAALSSSEEHTSELQSLLRITYAVFCLKKKKNNIK